VHLVRVRVRIRLRLRVRVRVRVRVRIRLRVRVRVRVRVRRRCTAAYGALRRRWAARLARSTAGACGSRSVALKTW